jgi:hypothetical protein
VKAIFFGMAFTRPLRHTAVWLTQRSRRCLCPSKGDGSQVVAELAVELNLRTAQGARHLS